MSGAVGDFLQALGLVAVVLALTGETLWRDRRIEHISAIGDTIRIDWSVP